MVRLQSGVLISWSGSDRQFTVNVPGAFQNKVCGLCGNFNGDPEDDWKMGEEKICPSDAFIEGKVVSQKYRIDTF